MTAAVTAAAVAIGTTTTDRRVNIIAPYDGHGHIEAPAAVLAAPTPRW
jgi:hypothetical protein